MYTLKITYKNCRFFCKPDKTVNSINYVLQNFFFIVSVFHRFSLFSVNEKEKYVKKVITF